MLQWCIHVWLLLSPEATRLTKSAFAALKKDHSQPMGASKACHESQSRICKFEAPMYVGVGEGTDNMDFLADLSALKATLKKWPEQGQIAHNQYREVVRCCCDS